MDTVVRLNSPGLTPVEVAAEYDKWSKGLQYDKEITEFHYNGPKLTATVAAKHLKDKNDVKILDVGAGSGQLAKELKKHGLHNIHALDPSKGMLEVARERQLYKHYIQEFFTNRVDALKTNSYDVLVSCGAFVEGHMKANVLGEMARCVKPGGLVVIGIREELLWTVPEYKDTLEPYMKTLEEERKWELLERTRVQEFFLHRDGAVFVYKVLK